MVTFTAASAGAVDSQTGYYTTNGIQYKNYASLLMGGANGIWSSTWTAGNTKPVPAGWMSSRGRLYNYNSGGLWCESQNVVNTTQHSVGTWIGASSCGIRVVGQRYQGYGVSRSWAGTSYTSWFTFKTVPLIYD